MYDRVVEALCASGSGWPKTVTVLASVVVLSGSTLAQEVVTRGDVLGDSPLVTLRHVMSDVDAYLDRTVTVEGSVGRVCQMKGCWMELKGRPTAPAFGSPSRTTASSCQPIRKGGPPDSRACSRPTYSRNRMPTISSKRASS